MAHQLGEELYWFQIFASAPAVAKAFFQFPSFDQPPAATTAHAEVKFSTGSSMSD